MIIIIMKVLTIIYINRFFRVMHTKILFKNIKYPKIKMEFVAAKWNSWKILIKLKDLII